MVSLALKNSIAVLRRRDGTLNQIYEENLKNKNNLTKLPYIVVQPKRIFEIDGCLRLCKSNTETSCGQINLLGFKSSLKLLNLITTCTQN
jgi:hypothetical protein